MVVKLHNVDATTEFFHFQSLLNKTFTNVIERFFWLKQDEMIWSIFIYLVTLTYYFRPLNILVNVTKTTPCLISF